MQEQSTKNVVIKTAAMTLAALVLACVIVAVIAFLCFPYNGYKFFADLGMKKSALFFVEQYEAKGNVDGLVYCVSLDSELLDKTGKQKYADKLIAHTQKFYSYENVNEYFAQLDEYYITSAPPQSRIGLYSYNEYVVSSNYVARCVVGQEEQMLLRGEPTRLNELFGADGITAIETATIYSALAKAMASGELELSLMVDGGSFTEFYYQLHSSVAPYVAGLNGSASLLETLFLLRSVIYLVDETIDYFANREVDISEQWQAFYTYEYNGLGLKDAYTEMYINYIATND